MKKIITTLAIASAALLSANVFANNRTAPVNLETISNGSSGNVFVGTDGTFVNPANCSITSKYMIEANDPQLKNYLAILLTAKASDAKVRLTLSSSTCLISGKYAKIANVEL